MKAKLRRLERDCRGVAAVEFAFILPVMVALYYGTLQTTNVLRTSRKVETAAHTLAGLVSRKLTGSADSPSQPAITQFDVVDLVRALSLLLDTANKRTGFEIDEIRVFKGENGESRAALVWAIGNDIQDGRHRSCGDDALRLDNYDDFDVMPRRLAQAVQSGDFYLISARVEYPHPFTQWLERRPWTMTRWSYALVRNQQSPGDIQFKVEPAKLRVRLNQARAKGLTLAGDKMLTLDCAAPD
jgi:TadE-like protein